MTPVLEFTRDTTPKVRNSDPRSGSPRPQRSWTARPHQKLNIVLVEDNRGDVLIIREALSHHSIDHNLAVYSNGEDMLEMVDRVDQGELPLPDVVLLDLNLPKHDGQSILQRIRQSPLWDAVPVIIVTSSNAARDRDSTSRLGATAYFRKPPNFDEYLKLGALIKKTVEPSN